MAVYRPKILASLALLAVVVAFFAGSVLLRPWPAGASATKSRSFVFGPLIVTSGQATSLYFFNTTHKPTPGGAVGFFNDQGQLLDSAQFDSVQPGRAIIAGGNLWSDPALLTAILTFSPPNSGQAIPDPFPGTMEIYDDVNNRLVFVLPPAR
jgi:hypothetical protein